MAQAGRHPQAAAARWQQACRQAGNGGRIQQAAGTQVRLGGHTASGMHGTGCSAGIAWWHPAPGAAPAGTE